MKTILTELKNSIIATFVFAIVLCGIYPLIVYGAGQLFFPHAANGSLIEGQNRELVGSELLGQMFSADKYFHPRPSAAGAGYDATNSSGNESWADFTEVDGLRQERGRTVSQRK